MKPADIHQLRAQILAQRAPPRSFRQWWRDWLAWRSEVRSDVAVLRHDLSLVLAMLGAITQQLRTVQQTLDGTLPATGGRIALGAGRDKET